MKLCKTASVYLPKSKCSLKNCEDPDCVCTGIPLACTPRLCPRCPVHGHSLLPPTLSSSTGQAGRGCRSRRLALGVCAAAFLRQDGSHHARSLATCPSPAWKRHLRSKTCLWTEVRRRTTKCRVFLGLPKTFYLPNGAALAGWETFSREELWNRKSGLVSLCMSGCGQNQSSCANMWKVIW